MAERDDELPEEKIDSRDLAGWEVPELPSNFSERVLAARGREVAAAQSEAPARGRRRGWAIGAIVGVAAVAALLFHSWAGEGQPAAGALEPGTERQSVVLAGRGVAVTEAGSALEWSVDRHGAAEVKQFSGDVFYRVEKGGSFRVLTPDGSHVTAVGTCFRVQIEFGSEEDETMKPNKHLIAGVAAGALIVVTVYEGRVLFANGDGKPARVEAGERAVSTDGTTVVARAGGPGDRGPGGAAASDPADVPAPPEANATRDQLLGRDENQRAEIAQLRRRVRELESGRRPGPMRGMDDDESWLNPTQEQLREWAKECRVHFDMPPMDDSPRQIGPEAAKKMGLTADEVAAFSRVSAAIFDRHIAEVRKLYIEVTGDSAGVENLSADAMASELRNKGSRGEGERAMEKISRERAGLQAPPSDLGGIGPVERYYRLLAAIGGDMEKALAAEIGPERAREIRKQNGGWGQRMASAGCPDSGEHGEESDSLR